MSDEKESLDMDIFFLANRRGVEVETWEKTNLFCPFCGSNNVWVDESAADYYAGSPHICVDGEHIFYFDDMSSPNAFDEQDKQRLSKLKEHTASDKS